MARLIINADDFGYTAGINRAVVELCRAGALCSTTLMASGPALNDALARSQGAAKLGIGCHVVLVDGRPVAAADEIRSLLGRDAAAGEPAGFRPTMGSFVWDLALGRIREQEIEREAVAQIRLLQARGVRVTHIDTHKHTHMFARVLRPLLRAALVCGVRAIRNPFEPEWSVAATTGAPLSRRAQVRALRLQRPAFLRLVHEAGLHTTAGAVGVLATGTLNAVSLSRLLDAAAGTGSGRGEATCWELVCHPGYDDAALGASHTRLKAAREREREALHAAVTRLSQFQLSNFGELAV